MIKPNQTVLEVHFHYELNSLQQEQWMAFWNGCQYAYPRQNVEYAEIEKAMGRTPVYVVGETGGSIVCVAIFSIRPLFFANKFSLEAYCLRGPAFNDASYFREFVQKIVSYFDTLNIGSVRISPFLYFPEAQEVLSVLDDIGFVPYYPREGSRSDTGRVDLSPSEDEILASLSKSTRYHIRRAEKLGVDIRPITHFDADDPGIPMSCRYAGQAWLDAAYIKRIYHAIPVCS